MNQKLLQEIEKKIQFIKDSYTDEKFESIMGTEHFHPMTNDLGIAYRQAKAEFRSYISSNQYEELKSYTELQKFDIGLTWREYMLKATFDQLKAVSKLVNVK